MMAKVSERMMELVREILRKEPEKTSADGLTLAAMLVHVGWNLDVDPGKPFCMETVRGLTKPVLEKSPGSLRELKSEDIRSLVEQVTRMKAERYPRDKRSILVCELTGQSTFRVTSMVRPQDSDFHDGGP